MMTDVAPAQPMGIRDARARTLWTAMFIALAAHLPFTPLPFVLRFLAAYLTRGDTSWDYTDDRVIIPISLLEDQGKPEEPPPPEPKATPAPAPTEPKPPKREHPPADAGAPDAETQEGGAVADAASERRGARDAGSPLATVADAHGDGAGPSVKDTMSLVGALKRTVQGKPNVALVLWFSTIRDHPLGGQVGNLLACNAQWRDFIGDLIDPLQDLDGVMLTGPRMADTSKVTAIAQHRLEDAKINEVMTSLAAKARRQGEGGPVPTNHPGMVAVRFHADRADRIAFTHPRKVIIITPPEGFDQLRDQPEPLSLPAGQGRAMSLTMVNPWRPLRAIGLRLPETLSELRLNVSASPDGSVNAEIEFDDQDATLAKAHATEMSEQGRALGGGFFLTDLEFVAQGNQLKAQTHISRIGGAFLIGIARNGLCPAGFDAGTRGP
jgi:hypothetical protein